MVLCEASRASSTKTRIETCGHVREWPCRRHQEQVPRKQGLKLYEQPTHSVSHNHQEQVPRKQGLKPVGTFVNDPAGEPSRASRASSTKTRIETRPPARQHSEVCSSRASSTKTRIETMPLWSHRRIPRTIKSKFHENKDWNLADRCQTIGWVSHQEQVPRKQGLKLMGMMDELIWDGPSRASSTKTRIETKQMTLY